jgi:GNAT superfamily N-acetyltransferase
MITAQVESFERCLPELIEIFPEHWRELALFQDRMPLEPQYAEYVRREREGLLVLITVRRAGKIVGYHTAHVAPGFHYGSTLTATMDMLYIREEARNIGLAIPLFRCMEKELTRRGCRVWYTGYKTHNPLGMPRLLTALNFQPADTYYAKWIGT